MSREPAERRACSHRTSGRSRYSNPTGATLRITRPPLPNDPTRKLGRRECSPIFSTSHRFDYFSRTLSVASIRMVVFHEGPTQPGFLDLAAIDESFRHTDHHLGVVGVVQGIAGRIANEMICGTKLKEDIGCREPLVWSTERIRNRKPKKAACEAVWNGGRTFPSAHHTQPTVITTLFTGPRRLCHITDRKVAFAICTIDEFGNKGETIR